MDSERLRLAIGAPAARFSGLAPTFRGEGEPARCQAASTECALVTTHLEGSPARPTRCQEPRGAKTRESPTGDRTVGLL
jgi:hypothetical protein